MIKLALASYFSDLLSPVIAEIAKDPRACAVSILELLDLPLHAVYITPQLPISNEKSAPKLRQIQRSVAFIVQDLLNMSASVHS